jgi:hypothetical protein
VRAVFEPWGKSSVSKLHRGRHLRHLAATFLRSTNSLTLHIDPPWICCRQCARKAAGASWSRRVHIGMLTWLQRRPRRVQMGRRQERCAARELPGPLAHGAGRALAAEQRPLLVRKGRHRIERSGGCAHQGGKAQAEGGRGRRHARSHGPASA